MDKKETLRNWPMTVMGGPALKNTNDAIKFASLAYDNIGFLINLMTQRVRLMHMYYVLKEDEKDNLRSMADIAFKVQFSHEAMKEVVNLRRAAFEGPVEYKHIDGFCPFCSEILSYHGEYGHCPSYAIDPGLCLVE